MLRTPTTDQKRHSRRRAATFALLGVWACTRCALAEIRAFRGEVLAVTQEVASDAPGSFSSDADAYDRTVRPKPIDAFAQLATTDTSGNPLAGARCVIELGDPTASTSGNPAEFALEAGSYSNDARVAYASLGTATERRDIRMTAADLLASSISGSPTPGSVVSTLFVTGALVFWCSDPDGGLGDTSATISILVRDSRRPQASLVEIRRTFIGGAMGTVTPADGADIGLNGAQLVTRIKDLEQLRTDGSPEAAQLVAEADALRLTRFVVVLIPEQTLQYSYPFALNQDFVLEAEFSIEIQGAPGGLGAAGVMGRPFAGLSELIRESSTGSDGKPLESAVNALMRSPDASTSIDAGVAPGLSTTRVCGAFGLEAPLVGLLAMSFPLWVACRRRPRTSASSGPSAHRLT